MKTINPSVSSLPGCFNAFLSGQPALRWDRHMLRGLVLVNQMTDRQYGTAAVCYARKHMN